jgi:hypothetical protein
MEHARRITSRKIAKIFAADDPRGDCKKREGGFLLAVSLIT